MYLKIGVGVFVFFGVAIMWGLWIWTSNPDRAMKFLVIAIVMTAAALYLMGSPRMTAWFKEAEKKLEIAEFRERQEQRASSGSSSGSVHTVTAQPHALADPETTKSLADLEKLLYTRVISHDEFKYAKELLFRSHSSQSTHDIAELLEKLSDLHEAGVLSEVEFTAAKLKALGLG